MGLVFLYLAFAVYFEMTSVYMLPSTAICEKEGCMYLHQEDKKTLKKFFCVGVGPFESLCSLCVVIISSMKILYVMDLFPSQFVY